MAPPPPERAVAAWLLILLATLAAAGHPPDLSRSLHDGRRGPAAMVLPLVFSYANASRHATAERRGYQRHLRQLQTAEPPESARMRLYDDLLSNGYYTTRLYIGTPPQEFALIVDSGSTVTYVPCSNCEQCGNHQDPRFQPELSSSYKPVKCNIDCSCDRETDQCTYERQYAEMSSSSGVLGEDVVSFGKEGTLKPQRAVFGCENMETGDLFSQHADGIMGLGRGSLSIVDQLVQKGAISDSFSLCYGGMDIGGGAMALGDIPFPPEMVFSRSDPDRSPYYNIELKEIHVSGEKLPLNSRIFNSKHGTVLDSGTTYVYLPEAAFVAFKDAIMSAIDSLQQIRGPDPTYKDICFAGGGSDISQLSKTFPEVDMVFSNGQKLSLSPENYLFKHSKVPGAYCLGVFQNGKDPTTLLGGIVVRNTLVTYDRANQRIGFWKTNCSELWKRLHLPGIPSAVPSDSFAWNSQSAPSFAPATPPEMAPSSSVLPAYDMQGQYRVGLVTFDVFLSANYSELAPHVMEFRDLIANNLDVNVSLVGTITTVELVSLRSDGNGSLARWSIMPGSGGFMSNARAMAFISSLTEHRVHFPDNFGSYKLVEWKVKQLSERTWLQQHGVALILGVVTTVLIFSAFIVWHFWRQRQGPGTYRPVGAPVPEHELQPL